MVILILPLFFAGLIGALAAAMGSMVGRAIIALGIGFVTYKGIDLAIDSLKEHVINGVKGLPADILSFLGFLWVDKALTIVFSAVVVALSIRAIGGSVKKVVLK